MIKNTAKSAYLPDCLMGFAAFCLLVWNAARLGIWEPWEADAASIVRNMLDSGNWLAVNVGTVEAPELLSNLPFGWWPQVASYGLLGETELALRLPNVLVCVCLIGAIYWVAHTYYDQTVARLSALVTLCMPLIIFNAGLALGSMLPQGTTAIACLWFLGGHANQWSRRWHIIGAWGWLTVAGLCAGLVGLCLPLLVFLSCGGTRHWRRLCLFLAGLPVGLSLIVLALGWWLASPHCPENLPIIQWLWFIDGLAIDRMAGFHPAFSLYVHQIGFGLFPWGALAPVAFGVLIFGNGVYGHKHRYITALFVWFAAAFAYGAMTYSWTHYALFLGASALALTLGPFFVHLLRNRTSNGFTILMAILLVALLDSNLKHDPRLLAEAFVGSDVETFPAVVGYSKWARLLNCAFLGLLLLFGTGIQTWVQRLATDLWYPKIRPLFFSPVQVLISIVTAAVLTSAFQHALLRMANRLAMRGLMNWAKLFIVGTLIGLVLHALIHWLWKMRFLRGQTFRKLLSLPDLAARSHFGVAGLVVVMAGWLCLQQVTIASTLTDNFSQRGLLNQYEQYRAALGNAPVYTYGLTARDRSYYARDLTEINSTKFTELCRKDEPFFAVIPQKNLAQVNDRFRKQRRTTGNQSMKHMPVLYDGGARFYLVASHLPEGATDLNPMKRALLNDESELPADVNRVDINFEDKVKIIGWKTEPKVARRGSPLKMTVYWKVLKNRVGSWKVFVHIDAPGQRLHGDHKPVAGLLPTENWRAGDLIADEHTIKVDRTKSPASFTFYTGLFRGSKRLKVTEGPEDGKDRAKLGRIILK